MATTGFPFRSALSTLAWPAVPNDAGAQALAMQYQLQQTQWWPAPQLEELQLRQLRILLRHARDHVPFWRERLDAARHNIAAQPTIEWLRTLPTLKRADVQAHGEALMCAQVPAEHGAVAHGQTSGSTGRPITYRCTELSQFFWRAFTLRDHLWHRRDFSGKLAAIRIKVERQVAQGWGPATDSAFVTGPCATLNIRTDIDEQLAWLVDQDPDYLITHPSNLRALLRRSLETGRRPLRLREARTFAESLPEDLRELCRRAWNVKLCDLYSAEETGYIALQCPDHDHYHVQAENLILEILDEKGNPSPPGNPGRVVVTPLSNFAMPLVRYEIGDYALPGAPCTCGRGLPVIERVLGRMRNLLRLPDGRRFYPSFPADAWSGIAPVRQVQVVQRTLEDIEIRLVAERRLDASEESQLAAAFRESLTHPFRVTFAYHDEIGRSGNYKFEDFISELGD